MGGRGGGGGKSENKRDYYIGEGDPSQHFSLFLSCPVISHGRHHSFMSLHISHSIPHSAMLLLFSCNYYGLRSGRIS